MCGIRKMKRNQILVLNIDASPIVEPSYQKECSFKFNRIKLKEQKT